MHSTLRNYDDVRTAFDSGRIVDASKQELEQLLIAVGREQIHNPINQARTAQMGETMRLLLAARQSQEMHSEALRISKVALWVAVAAFVASLVQSAVAMNVIAPLESPLIGRAAKTPEQQMPPSQKIPPTPKS